MVTIEQIAGAVSAEAVSILRALHASSEVYALVRVAGDRNGNVAKGSCIFAFRYDLAGGACQKISETLPSGEYDWWAPWDVFKDMQRETGREPDLSRLFFVEQTGHGKAFTLFAPVK
jgi:hypothetical protein